MPFENAIDAQSLDSSGILVVFPESLDDHIRRLVDRHSTWDWDQRGRVVLLSIPMKKLRDVSYVTSTINDRAHNSINVEFELYNVGDSVPRRGESDRKRRLASVSMHRLRGDIKFAQNNLKLMLPAFENKLKKSLKAKHLDWLSCVETMLINAWLHGTLDRGRIEQWLRQFESLGSYEWIGERLLRLLDFWPCAKVMKTIAKKCRFDDFDVVCVNRRVKGKSADILATQIKKIRGTVDDFYETLNAKNTKANGSILYIEDCLLTGTEMISLLTALLGQTSPGRTPKVPPLDNLQRLQSWNIQACFAVAANWGCETVRQFLDKHGLRNISVFCGDATRVETLTEAGLQALRKDDLYDQDRCVKDQATHVRPGVFHEDAIWGKADKRERAMNFCRHVGFQLFSAYLKQKKWNWNPARTREAALGARGNALALAFGHSVPKETLPLFWMGGPVTVGRKKLSWEPLFPNAVL